MVHQTTFQCSCCGERLSAPLAWHFNAPDLWSSAERNERSELTSDFCVINGEHFFIRGLIEIPVLDGDGPFAWGVWISLSEKNFKRTRDLWESPNRANEPPSFGWLSNAIPGYPETQHLKTNVHSRAVGLRPYVDLEPTAHPLAVEQRTGITMARVRQIAEQMHHHNSPRPTDPPAAPPQPKKKRFWLF